MKTLVIDAIVGVGFPTITVALTAEQGGLATFRAGYLEGGHVWRRDKLEELDLKTLQMMYSGLRSQREIVAEEVAQPPLAPVIAIHQGMH